MHVRALPCSMNPCLRPSPIASVNVLIMVIVIDGLGDAHVEPASLARPVKSKNVLATPARLSLVQASAGVIVSLNFTPYLDMSMETRRTI